MSKIYNVRVKIAGESKSGLFPGTKTPREIFRELDMEIGSAVPMINLDIVLSGELLDTPLDNLPIEGDKVTLSAFVKHDNAASCRVLGQNVQLESDHPVEDFTLVEKFDPSRLVVKRGDEELFRVMTGEEPSVSRFGIVLAPQNTASGKAYTTATVPDGEDAKSWIMNNLGSAIMHLDSIDHTLGEVVAAANAERLQIEGKISIL